MATIQIYGVPPSPFTRATRLAAREKGVEYELVPTRPGGTAPLNPLGKIPMMKHGDFTLYESPAIARYIDRMFDGPPLWPKDARAAALCDQWLSVVCDSMVQTALAGVIGPRFGIIPGTEEGIQVALKRSERVVGLRQASRRPSFSCRRASDGGRSLPFADLFLFSRNSGVESAPRVIT